MTVYQSGRAVLALAALVVASTSIGAPMPLVACPRHPPIAHHVRSGAQVHRTDKAIAPHFPAARSGDHVADPFAAIHLE